VKTSTGFAPSGATLEDIALMRAASPPHVRVKAAGGIRTLDDLLAARAAGADRIGTSSTAAILHEVRRRVDRGDTHAPSATRLSDGY
jgi:deoxyribose-phosphate aldolase